MRDVLNKDLKRVICCFCIIRLSVFFVTIASMNLFCAMLGEDLPTQQFIYNNLGIVCFVVLLTDVSYVLCEVSIKSITLGQKNLHIWLFSSVSDALKIDALLFCKRCSLDVNLDLFLICNLHVCFEFCALLNF